MAWPAVNRGFTQEQFRLYVGSLKWSAWRPSLIVWHNTAAPSLAQWHKTAEKDVAAGLPPGTTRMNNLENYFRYQRGWSGCPHLFIADDLIWVANPLTAPGVHSPSWNGRSIGIEMVADFDREDDDTGAGFEVKQNTIFATAILCETFGLDPFTAIKLHREDPRTTHACPGADFSQDKQQTVEAVAALMSGGEHSEDDVSDAIGVEIAPTAFPEWRGIVTATSLNFRRGPGVNNESTGSLPKGVEVTVIGSARNGTDEWLNVKTPAGYVGWVSGKYVNIT